VKLEAARPTKLRQNFATFRNVVKLKNVNIISICRCNLN
jgi:hypothetical protein